MKCADFKAQVEGYALHALEPAEEAACTAHLSEVQVHEGCLEALAQVVNTLGALAEALPPVTPSPAVWARLSSQLGPQVAPVAAPRRGLRIPASFRRRGPSFWTLAAAAAALLVVGAWNRWVHTGATVREARQDLVALLGDPGTQVFPLKPAAGSGLSARVLYHPARKEAVVVFQGAEAAVGHDYELWVIKGGEKRPVGLLRPDPSGRFVAVVQKELLADGVPDALAVTLEPKGGGASPRGPILLVGSPGAG